jgi:hypothetical protein
VTQVQAPGPALSPVAEPSRKVGKRWIALIALANLGLLLGYLAPLGCCCPIRSRRSPDPPTRLSRWAR